MCFGRYAHRAVFVCTRSATLPLTRYRRRAWFVVSKRSCGGWCVCVCVRVECDEKGRDGIVFRGKSLCCVHLAAKRAREVQPQGQGSSGTGWVWIQTDAIKRHSNVRLALHVLSPVPFPPPATLVWCVYYQWDSRSVGGK